jgi:hypothetical protein
MHSEGCHVDLVAGRVIVGGQLLEDALWDHEDQLVWNIENQGRDEQRVIVHQALGLNNYLEPAFIETGSPFDLYRDVLSVGQPVKHCVEAAVQEREKNVQCAL